jgi:hypothetical protein
VSTIMRMWLGFATLCAGIIHLALIGSSPAPVAVVLAVIGVTECGWGLSTFVRVRILLPRVVLLAALAPILIWGVLVAAAAVSKNPAVASYLGFDSMALASILDLFTAIVLALHVRKGTDFSSPTRDTSAPRYLLGVVLGGLVAAAIVTPALSASDAGRYAKPMDAMPGMTIGAPATLVLGPAHHTPSHPAGP